MTETPEQTGPTDQVKSLLATPNLAGALESETISPLPGPGSDRRRAVRNGSSGTYRLCQPGI